MARSALAVRGLAQRATPVPLEGEASCRVLLSEWTGSPVTWGVVRPTILLPAAAAGWSAERRQVVLAHELAHIARRDWMWQILGRLVGAVYWFHPLVWVAVAKLRDESERACDDRVLGCVKASDYAAHLVEIAKSLRRTNPDQLLALSMVRVSELERRLVHILNSPCSRRRATRRAYAVAAMAAVILVLPLAAMQKDHGKTYKIGGDVTTPTLRHKVEPGYTDEARDAKIQGTVVLAIEVDAEGNVASARVIRGLEPGLDQKAVEALRQWKFDPATRKGKPVRVQAKVEVNFKLK
jgi:TonB family protein